MNEESGKKYTVMELAELVGVPRTTINDWLAKYTIYIQSVQQGRRRLYTESALAVLKKIASLRLNGLGTAEIEAELGATCAIQPQPETPRVTTDKKDASPEGALLKTASADTALMKQNAEEILTRFREMMEKIDRLEAAAQHPAPAVRNRLFLLTLFLLAVFLCAGALLAKSEFDFLRGKAALREREIKRQADSNRCLQQKIGVLNAKKKAFEQDLSRLRGEVEQGKTERREDAANAARQLAELKKAQENALQAEKLRRDAEAELQKERFEKSRLDFLHQLKEKTLETEKITAEKKLLELKKAELEKTCAAQADALRKQTPPSAAAPEKANSAKHSPAPASGSTAEPVSLPPAEK